MSIYNFKNREVKIDFNSIQFGNSAYINQPPEIIDFIKCQQEEIERLNNIIDKKEQFLGDNIKRLERQVVKRDNIINELEKYINEDEWTSVNGVITAKLIKDKIKELKGGNKE